MDRQEAIQTLSKVGKISVSYAEDLYDSFFPKPVVPQFVADWIEKNKGKNNLRNVLITAPVDGKIYGWLNQHEDGVFVNQETFALAWILGYTVEKEKRYLVKLRGVEELSRVLNHDASVDEWLMADKGDTEAIKTHHTRKELEANGFGWVFDCPGVEVKEVANED